jgi:ribonuclease HII
MAIGGRLRPSLDEERSALARGCGVVAGVDEVGRGAWAGPVAAAAVALPIDSLHECAWLGEVADSKVLTAARRERLASLIESIAVSVGFGLASPTEIDAIGIAPATRLAMMRALAQLTPAPDMVLVDYLRLPDLTIPQKGIVHGDALCVSIAASSIVAKVRRDALMQELEATHPGYGLGQHKGYGTVLHREALARLGPSPIHRMSYVPLRELSRVAAAE